MLDRGVFDELFDLHYEDLVRFIHSFINDVELSKDLTHDIFLHLWHKRSDYNPDKSIKTYLFTAARNQSLNYIKHRKVIEKNIKHISYIQEKSDSYDVEELQERLEKIEKKITELPDKQQKVLIKCCIDGRSYKEVATELNISVNTVRTHLVRALKFLREELCNNILLLFISMNIKEYFRTVIRDSQTK